MLLMALTLRNTYNFENSAWYGYAGIILSMLFVYVGVKAYRDKTPDGSITFARALGIGLLITLISAVCYVIAWEVISKTLMPDFYEKIAQCYQDKMKASGESQTAIQDQMMQFNKMRDNILIESAMAFIEPLPVGLLVTLISAGILRKNKV
jgi:hypothetical protein